MTQQPVIDSNPQGDDRKRVAVEVNEQFRTELHYKARKDGTTVSELTRQLWEQYLAGYLKVVKD